MAKRKKATEKPKTITIEVAYCKKCGRLLTGKKSIAEGIGRGCKEKTQYQKRLEAQGQLRLFPD